MVGNKERIKITNDLNISSDGNFLYADGNKIAKIANSGYTIGTKTLTIIADYINTNGRLKLTVSKNKLEVSNSANKDEIKL